MGSILEFLHSSAYAIPAFLFLITVVVFFHELGHFAVARFFGTKVDTFSIGFGPAIVKWHDSKGTLWKISWIPLGGFVKFFGDADGASTPDREATARMSAEDRKVAFPYKPLWQRALIVAAGPVANFILAIGILMGLFMISGQIVLPAKVGYVQPHSAADAAGIKIGDEIVNIDGVDVPSFQKMVMLVSISAGQQLPVTLDRAGHRFTVFVTPRETTDDNGNRVGRLGIGPGKLVKARIVRLGPIDAFNAAVGEISDILSTTYRALTHTPSGAKQLSGPLGILKLSGQVAQVSILALVELVALLSVSIGLVNLFPIPLLDGGHLLYYACEGVLRRPLSERAQDVGFRLGLAVVLGIFLLATWNDLVRLNLF